MPVGSSGVDERVALAVFGLPVVSALPAGEQLAKEDIVSIRDTFLAYLEPNAHFVDLGDGSGNKRGSGIVCTQNGHTSVRLVGTMGRARILLSCHDNLVDTVAYVARHHATKREVSDHVDCAPLSDHIASLIPNSVGSQ
jgi:hypothetical protein